MPQSFFEVNVGSWSSIPGTNKPPVHPSPRASAAPTALPSPQASAAGSNIVTNGSKPSPVTGVISTIPTPRSMHSTVTWGDSMYLFGGYDGTRRLNDFHEYNFTSKIWSPVKARGVAPTPRDRHSACVTRNSMYVFGGHDGAQRLGDIFLFDFVTQRWSCIAGGRGPSPRHSHSMCVYHDDSDDSESIFVFGGFDASYRSDVHSLNLATHQWSKLETSGHGPTPRYRSSLSPLRGGNLVVIGGHDGSRHLNDVYTLAVDTATWSRVYAVGLLPIVRDSHTVVPYGDSLIVFGGSSGSAMNDLHELQFTLSAATPAVLHTDEETSAQTSSDLDGSDAEATSPRLSRTPLARKKTSVHLPVVKATWVPLFPGGIPPSPRFCHSATLANSSTLVVFGGYDMTQRNNDLFFLNINVGRLGVRVEVPPSSLAINLSDLVASEKYADVWFELSESQQDRVPGHRAILSRLAGINKLFLDSKDAPTLKIDKVDTEVFRKFLGFAYTDSCDPTRTDVVQLYNVANRFGATRLEAICQNVMQDVITPQNAAGLFALADKFDAAPLRTMAFQFILAHFDDVSVTAEFEEMGRTRVDLVFELLKSRRTAAAGAGA